MTHAVIAATGLFTPEQSVSNAELIDSYNAWADGWNARHAAQIEAELRTTSQRVNLFEKVKIPECRETIRLIGIALGDEQTSAVARGKIAKSRDKSGESAPVAEEGAA